MKFREWDSENENSGITPKEYIETSYPFISNREKRRETWNSTYRISSFIWVSVFKVDPLELLEHLSLRVQECDVSSSRFWITVKLETNKKQKHKVVSSHMWQKYLYGKIICLLLPFLTALSSCYLSKAFSHDHWQDCNLYNVKLVIWKKKRGGGE